MLRKAIVLAAATSSVSAYSSHGYDTSISGLGRRDLTNAQLARRMNLKRDVYGGAIYDDHSDLLAREAEAAPLMMPSKDSSNGQSSTWNIGARQRSDSNDTSRQVDNSTSQRNDKSTVQTASKPVKYLCEGKLVISHPESTVVKRDLDETDLDYSVYAREAEAYNRSEPPSMAESRTKTKATAFVCHGSMVPAPPKAKRDVDEDEFVSSGLYARDAEPEASPVVPVPDPHANLADAHKIAIYNAVMLDRQQQDAKAQAASNKATVRTAGKPKARRDNFDEEMMYDLFARDAEPEAEAAAPAPAKPLPAIMPYVPLKAAPNAKPAPPPAAKAAAPPAPAKAVPAPAAAKPAAAKPAPTRPKRDVEFDDEEFVSTLYARDAEPEARGGMRRVISKVPWKKMGKGAMNGAVNAATQSSYSQPIQAPPPQDQYQTSSPQGNDLSPANVDSSNQVNNAANYNNYNRRTVDYSAEDDFPFALYSRDADSGDDREILEYKARLADLQAKYAHLQLEEADGKAPTVHSRDVDGGSVSYSSDWFARDAMPEGDFDVEFAELLARDLENGELFEREAEPEMSEYEALFEPEAWF